MFEDEYRKEMEGLHASEPLITDTLRKMQEEQSRLHGERSGLEVVQPRLWEEQSGLQGEQSGLEGEQSGIQAGHPELPKGQLGLRDGQGANAPGRPAAPDARAEKARKRPLLLVVGLPAAACLVLAFLGVALFFQQPGLPPEEARQHFVFQLVDGNTSLTGGLLFGNAGQLPDGAGSGLKRAECPEALLPEGILEATPVELGGFAVYLGFDEQQATYYAAYREDSSDGTWVVLLSTDLGESGFIEALKDYFAR